MTEQAWWAVAIVAVVISGALGYFIGRPNSGSRSRVEELEGELAREKAEMERYRSSVDAHFEQTAGLFVSMAGSYKALFEHLAVGYDKLAPGTSHELFKEKVAALLLDAPSREVMAADEDKPVDAPAEADAAAVDAAAPRGGAAAEPTSVADAPAGDIASAAQADPSKTAESAADTSTGSTGSTDADSQSAGPGDQGSQTNAASVAAADDNASSEEKPRA